MLDVLRNINSFQKNTLILLVTFPLLLLSMQTMRLVLESMMLRMEEYANSLENLVTERTEDYFAEKKKTEDLLYELLPK